jgi:hypothetical protein
MTFNVDMRGSDSPLVECVVRGQSDDTFSLMCPADGRWNISISKLNGKTEILVEGPMTRAAPRTHVEGADWLVIKLKLGVYLSCIPARDYLDSGTPLSAASNQSFWLNSATWQIPDYENADTFADWLMRDEIVQFNPVVRAALEDKPQDISRRTIRHHFSRTVGMTESHIRQIERARDAQTLLQQDVPILDVVDRLAYADQPHLTRSLKRFMGYTPTQLAGFKIPT